MIQFYRDMFAKTKVVCEHIEGRILKAYKAYILEWADILEDVQQKIQQLLTNAGNLYTHREVNTD